MLDIAALQASTAARRALVNAVADEHPVVTSAQGQRIAVELSRVIHGETLEERQAAAQKAHQLLRESGAWR